MNTPARNSTASNLIRRGFDWSGTTGRLPYILVSIAAIGLASLIPVTRNFSGANTAVFVSLTMIFPMWLGHTRRRLRDVGWTGWLMWIAILPIVGLILTILLAFKPGGDIGAPEDKTYSRLGFAISLAFGVMLLSRAFWAPYWVPAGSMKPTLLVGDFLAVIPVNQPERGDVLVFWEPNHNAEFIKRLIGLPGDEISMSDGVVFLNGEALQQANPRDFAETFAPQGALRILPRCHNQPIEGEVCLKTRLTEILPDGQSYDVLDISPHGTDTIAPVTVPEGHYFFIGDHRDNSADSRLSHSEGGLGLIPREALVGKVALVFFSSAGSHMMQAWTWRPDRFLKRVQ